MARRTRLEKILERIDNAYVRFSETFSGPERLLAECKRRGIEVSYPSARTRLTVPGNATGLRSRPRSGGNK